MRRLRSFAATGCLVLAACSSSASSTVFDLSEFTISGPESLASGASTVEVANSGNLPHTLVITDDSGQVVAATDLIPPGETAALDVNLEDGRYSFTCRVVAENGEGEIVDHFEMGMSETVEVGR